jgi:hypothetical protein
MSATPVTFDPSMLPAPLVSSSRMKTTRISPLALAGSGAFLALVAACGQLTPLDDDEQACPCAPGYTCCNGVCLAGDGTIALGTQSVPGASDASVLSTVQTVSGNPEGVLDEGITVPFSYATSIWPTPYGWGLQGWILSASAGQSLRFQVWAEEDAGIQPLSLVMYGPLEVLDARTCSGPAVGNGALVGAEILWTAPAQGTFFAAAFHEVVETPVGLAFEGLNDSNYAHAFIVVNSAE